MRYCQARATCGPLRLHRGHGHVHSGNFYHGIGAPEQDGRWVFNYSETCRFVFEGANSLIAVSGSGADQVRLRYRFHEDRIVLALAPPTNPTLEYTMWMGEFDALGEPRHNGAESKGAVAAGDKKSAGAITADWFFFPHPVHRQGVLLITPPKTSLRCRGTAVNFPLRLGQEVTLRFAAADETPGAEEPSR